MIKRTESILSNVGAHRIGTLGFEDDADGSLKDDFLIWKDEMLSQLAKHLGLAERKRTTVINLAILETESSSETPLLLGEPNAAHRKGKLKGPKYKSISSSHDQLSRTIWE